MAETKEAGINLQEATASDLARACLQVELENRRLKAENVRLRAVLSKVAHAHATYAYAEPNFGVLLSLKDEARAALSQEAPHDPR